MMKAEGSDKTNLMSKNRLREDKERKEAEKRKDLAHNKLIMDKARELNKKRYTYDFNGNLIFLK